MDSKHTPGPWTALPTNNGGWGVYATPLQYNVLDASAPGIQAEANARLIAAAPELLSALQAMHKTFHELGAIHVDVYRQATAAIAKATQA